MVHVYFGDQQGAQHPHAKGELLLRGLYPMCGNRQVLTPRRPLPQVRGKSWPIRAPLPIACQSPHSILIKGVDLIRDGLPPNVRTLPIQYLGELPKGRSLHHPQLDAIRGYPASHGTLNALRLLAGGIVRRNFKVRLQISYFGGRWALPLLLHLEHTNLQ